MGGDFRTMGNVRGRRYVETSMSGGRPALILGPQGRTVKRIVISFIKRVDGGYVGLGLVSER